jgi:protoheme IX farnesyltransferase
MVAVSLVFAPVAHMGGIYVVVAAVLGGGFVWMALRFQRQPTPATAMKLFGFSITYLTVLFAAIALDQLVAKA